MEVILDIDKRRSKVEALQNQARRTFFLREPLHARNPHPILLILTKLSYDYFGESYENIPPAPEISFKSSLPLRALFSLSVSDRSMLLQKENAITSSDAFIQGTLPYFIPADDTYEEAVNKLREVVNYLRVPDLYKTYEDMLPTLESLWKSFPYTDIRLGIAYGAFQKIKGHHLFSADHQISSRDVPFDPQVLLWAEKKENSEILALRYVCDFVSRNDLGSKPELRSIGSRDISKLFISRAQKDKGDMDVLLLAKTIHRKLSSFDDQASFQNDAVKFLYNECGLKEHFQGFSLHDFRRHHMLIDDYPQDMKLFIETYNALKTGSFFREIYYKKYRQLKDKAVQDNCASLPHTSSDHPFYSLKSDNPWELRCALVYSVSHDLSTFKDFNDNYPIERLIGGHCLNPEQKDALNRLSKMKKDGNNHYEKAKGITTNPSNWDFNATMRTNGLGNPNAIALVRLFKTSTEIPFVERMGLMGLPFKNGSEQSIEAMAKLIDWMGNKTEGKIVYSHMKMVARCYLMTELYSHFRNYKHPVEIERIMDRIISCTGDERINMAKCPELLLAATNLQKEYTMGLSFSNLNEYPFKDFEKLLETLRFGPRRIEERNDFALKIGGVLENYDRIVSRNWQKRLQQEMIDTFVPQELYEKFFHIKNFTTNRLKLKHIPTLTLLGRG